MKPSNKSIGISTVSMESHHPYITKRIGVVYSYHDTLMPILNVGLVYYKQISSRRVGSGLTNGSCWWLLTNLEMTTHKVKMKGIRHILIGLCLL